MRLCVKLNRLGNLAKNLLFPPRCISCGELLDTRLRERVGVPLCKECRASFEHQRLRECPRCGLQMKFCRCMPTPMKRAQCLSLLKLVPYDPDSPTSAGSRFIYSVKSNNNAAMFSFFAEQMRALLISEMRAESLEPEDCVIAYLPRSYKNLAENGFDQSKKLTTELSRITGIPTVSIFKRKLHAKKQKELTRVERRLNMESAYTGRDVGDALRGKVVILVDDIVTTGSSMASCARIATSLGAYAVFGVCIGVTEKNSKNKQIKH